MPEIPMPVPLDDVMIAFPALALEFMPKWEDLPEDFQSGKNPWCDFAYVWFNHGLNDHFSFTPATIGGKEVDSAMAYRQLTAIMRSYAPKHQHKIAAVAWLASQWMESMIYGYPDEALEELTALGETPLEEWVAYFKEEEAK